MSTHNRTRRRLWRLGLTWKQRRTQPRYVYQTVMPWRRCWALTGPALRDAIAEREAELREVTRPAPRIEREILAARPPVVCVSSASRARR